MFACLSLPHGKSIGTKLDEDQNFMFRGLGLFTDDVDRSSTKRLRDRDRYKGYVTYVQVPPPTAFSLAVRGAARRGFLAICHSVLLTRRERWSDIHTDYLLRTPTDRRG